jgi:hypothetical protein
MARGNQDKSIPALEQQIAAKEEKSKKKRSHPQRDEKAGQISAEADEGHPSKLRAKQAKKSQENGSADELGAKAEAEPEDPAVPSPEYVLVLLISAFDVSDASDCNFQLGQ